MNNYLAADWLILFEMVAYCTERESKIELSETRGTKLREHFFS